MITPSIREFGFAQPIVVDKDSVIIVGHTRLKAAQKLGLERVPVVIAPHLTPDQVRAYPIADNKTYELAEWNDDICQLKSVHSRKQTTISASTLKSWPKTIKVTNSKIAVLPVSWLTAFMRDGINVDQIVGLK